ASKYPIGRYSTNYGYDTDGQGKECTTCAIETYNSSEGYQDCPLQAYQVYYYNFNAYDTDGKGNGYEKCQINQIVYLTLSCKLMQQVIVQKMCICTQCKKQAIGIWCKKCAIDGWCSVDTLGGQCKTQTIGLITQPTIIEQASVYIQEIVQRNIKLKSRGQQIIHNQPFNQTNYNKILKKQQQNQTNQYLFLSFTNYSKCNQINNNGYFILLQFCPQTQTFQKSDFENRPCQLHLHIFKKYKAQKENDAQARDNKTLTKKVRRAQIIMKQNQTVHNSLQKIKEVYIAQQQEYIQNFR
ncbi:hypothetical protein ABPG72_008726, partial [Tetrahymena utriculariae]